MNAAGKTAYTEFGIPSPSSVEILKSFIPKDELWPTAANNNLISYRGELNPAFHAVSNACRPQMASARNYKFVWREGELFRCELWMLNDQYRKLEPGTVRTKLLSGEDVIELENWSYEGAEENANIQGPCLERVLPRLSLDRFTLEIEVEGHPDLNSAYLFLYKPSA